MQHRHLPARGLLSLFSFLRAFLLTVIKRDQTAARPQFDPHGNGIRIGESDMAAPSDGDDDRRYFGSLSPPGSPLHGGKSRPCEPAVGK